MSSNKFDWEFYVKRYNLINKGIDNKKKAIKHYVIKGSKEKLFPNEDAEKNSLNKNENMQEYNYDLENDFFNNINKELESSIEENIDEFNFEINNDDFNIKNEIISLKNELKNLNYKLDILICDKSDKLSVSTKSIDKKHKSKNIKKENIDKIQSSEEYELNNNLSDSDGSENKEIQLYSNDLSYEN